MLWLLHFETSRSALLSTWDGMFDATGGNTLQA